MKKTDAAEHLLFGDAPFIFEELSQAVSQSLAKGRDRSSLGHTARPIHSIRANVIFAVPHAHQSQPRPQEASARRGPTSFSHLNFGSHDLPLAFRRLPSPLLAFRTSQISSARDRRSPGRLRTWPPIPSLRLHRVRLIQAGLETPPSGRFSRIMAASYSSRRAQAAWNDGSSNDGLKAGDRKT